MKATDKIYRISDNKRGIISQVIGMNLFYVKYLDGTTACEDLNSIMLLPEQELLNMISESINTILKSLIELKCWFVIFWTAKLNSSDQKWINRMLLAITVYFLVRTFLIK